MKIVKVTSKGQITLPQTMRKKLNIREGDYLDITVKRNSLILKPSPKENNSEIILEYCEKYSAENASLEETRKILKKVPFSLSKKSSKLREKKNDL